MTSQQIKVMLSIALSITLIFTSFLPRVSDISYADIATERLLSLDASSLITATSAKRGQKVGDSTIKLHGKVLNSEGEEIPGTVVWVNPDINIGSSQYQMAKWMFLPEYEEDKQYYATLEGDLPILPSKAEKAVKLIGSIKKPKFTIGDYPYEGPTLEEGSKFVSVENEETEITGTFEWINNGTPVEKSGHYVWQFYPISSLRDTYGSLTGISYAEAIKPVPKLSGVVTAEDVYIGKKLSDIHLKARFTRYQEWDMPGHEMPDDPWGPPKQDPITGTLTLDNTGSETIEAGEKDYAWTFTPTGADADIYSEAKGNITLTGEGSSPDNPTYTVTFNTNGGSAINPLIEVTSGSAITAPTAPTKLGFVFEGWYKNQALTSKWNFETDKITSDTTLYANWTENKYTVTFNSDGGSDVDSLGDLSSDSIITAPTAPTKSGHTFGGWYKDSTLENKWNFDADKVTKDTTLYAKWEKIEEPNPEPEVKKYTVNFNTNGGSSVSSLSDVTSDSKIQTPTQPTKSGHTFEGWYKDSALENKWNFETDKVTADTTLYAKWLYDFGGGVTGTLKDGTLTVSKTDPNGSGEMTDYDYVNTKSPIFGVEGITNVVIGDGVKHIGNYSFYKNGLMRIKGTISIGKDVITIGESAFMSNPLSTLTLGEGVKTIGKSAFNNNRLTSLTIPDSVTIIGEEAFKYSVSLISLTLGKGIETIGKEAFYNCKLESLIIPDSVTTIGDSAFFANTSLKSLTLGKGLETIGQYAFGYCKLESLTIPNSVKTIGDSAFVDIKLNTIIIPSEVTVGSNFCKNGDFTSNYNTDNKKAGKYIYNPDSTKWVREILKHTVTFNSNGGSDVTSLTDLTSDSTITAPTAPTKSGFTFEGWYKEETLETKWNFGTDKVTNNTTLYAKWKKISSNSAGGGYIPPQPPVMPPPPPPVVIVPSNPTDSPLKPTEAIITLPGDKGKVNVPDKVVSDAIKKALEESKKNNLEQNGISIEIKIDNKNNSSNGFSTNLPKLTVDELSKKEVKEFKVNSQSIILALDLETIKTMQTEINADINLSAQPVDNKTLSQESKLVVGNRPVFDLTLTGTNGKKVSNFGKGKVLVTIPYTLGEGEKVENIVAYYIANDGKIEQMPNTVYDEDTKTVRFFTDHFSKFAVGYNIKEFDLQTDVELDKVWTIKFNKIVDEDSVNENSIYIQDESGNKVSLDRKVENNKVILTPKDSYKPATKYTIHVTDGVESNKKILKPYILKSFETVK